MTKKLLLYPSLLVLFAIVLTSCGRYSYPREVGFYRVKKDKNKNAVVKQTKITRETEQMSSLPAKDVTIVTSLSPEPSIAKPIDENYLASSGSRKPKNVKNISNIVNGLIAGNTDSKISMGYFVNQTANSITSTHYDEGTHLALKGLIFLLIGIVLVNGIWLTGALGFVLLIIGIIFIIYGVVLLLESL
jgi:hypothetical protein